MFRLNQFGRTRPGMVPRKSGQLKMMEEYVPLRGPRQCHVDLFCHGLREYYSKGREEYVGEDNLYKTEVEYLLKLSDDFKWSDDFMEIIYDIILFNRKPSREAMIPYFAEMVSSSFLSIEVECY